MRNLCTLNVTRKKIYFVQLCTAHAIVQPQFIKSVEASIPTKTTQWQKINGSKNLSRTILLHHAAEHQRPTQHEHTDFNLQNALCWTECDTNWREWALKMKFFHLFRRGKEKQIPIVHGVEWWKKSKWNENILNTCTHCLCLFFFLLHFLRNVSWKKWKKWRLLCRCRTCSVIEFIGYMPILLFHMQIDNQAVIWTIVFIRQRDIPWTYYGMRVAITWQ